MKAILKNYRQSPRKVRLVANLIKGKNVKVAETELDFLVKRAALPFKQLLKSAIANAKNNFGANEDELYVKEVTVDKGVVYKRFMPRARGSASRINKRTSHLVITLGVRQVGTKETKKEKKVAKKALKKAEKILKPKKDIEKTHAKAGQVTKKSVKKPIKKAK
ncbi:MAG: 50S ribosomal protein L22 [Candidatus Paceibacterota bacterium]|jgi:large subunit ribosomal protein L22